MNITEFVGLRPKSCFYLIDDASSDTHATKVDEKTKGTKRCVTKTILVFSNCKKFLLRNEIVLTSHQRFKCEAYNYIISISCKCYIWYCYTIFIWYIIQSDHIFQIIHIEYQ